MNYIVVIAFWFSLLTVGSIAVFFQRRVNKREFEEAEILCDKGDLENTIINKHIRSVYFYTSPPVNADIIDY